MDLWVNGMPLHNHLDDECCPDFSCCKPSLIAPEETRKRFQSANNEEQMGMLAEFLGKGIESMGNDTEVSTSQDVLKEIENNNN